MTEPHFTREGSVDSAEAPLITLKPNKDPYLLKINDRYVWVLAAASGESGGGKPNEKKEEEDPTQIGAESDESIGDFDMTSVGSDAE